MIDISIVEGTKLFESCLSINRKMDTEPFEKLAYFSCSEFEKETHIVAKAGDRLVGNIALRISPYKPRTMWVMQVAVLEEFEGQGIATSLIDKCMSFVGDMGFSLEVSSFSEMGDQRIRKVFERKALEYVVQTSYNN